MTRFKVVESEIMVGRCSKCGKSIKYGSVGVRVVKVIDLKENREEWRCNNCVRGLSQKKNSEARGSFLFFMIHSVKSKSQKFKN